MWLNFGGFLKVVGRKFENSGYMAGRVTWLTSTKRRMSESAGYGYQPHV
jgi:hypothetical protein